jgi:nitrite reductase (NO-forming)
MIVYIFYEQNPGVSRKLLTAGFVALAVLVLLAAAVFAGVGTPAPLPPPNVSVTLYAGSVSQTVYGFGNSATSITSPGPTLTFKVGDVVNMTVVNVGNMPHNWALVTTNQTSAKVLFGAQIDSGSVPIEMNQTGSVVFKVAQSGNFNYICQVPGHVSLGMWGSVVINP